jgi:hypothetical protein
MVSVLPVGDCFAVISRYLLAQEKVLAGNVPQDHALEPVQIVQTITGGFMDRRNQWFGRVLANHAQQSPQGKSNDLPAALLQSCDVFVQLGQNHDNRFFFRMGIGAL